MVRVGPTAWRPFPAHELRAPKARGSHELPHVQHPVGRGREDVVLRHCQAADGVAVPRQRLHAIPRRRRLCRPHLDELQGRHGASREGGRMAAGRREGVAARRARPCMAVGRVRTAAATEAGLAQQPGAAGVSSARSRRTLSSEAETTRPEMEPSAHTTSLCADTAAHSPLRRAGRGKKGRGGSRGAGTCEKPQALRSAHRGPLPSLAALSEHVQASAATPRRPQHPCGSPSDRAARLTSPPPSDTHTSR